MMTGTEESCTMGSDPAERVGEGHLGNEGQQEEGDGVRWYSRLFTDGVTGVSNRLWVRNREDFPKYRFTSRQIWGGHKKLRGDEDRWPDWHQTDKPDNFEAVDRAVRRRRKPDYFEAGGNSAGGPEGEQNGEKQRKVC